jgi:DNA-directed RNA polymerase subunit RPC12/RpoP
VIFVMRKDQFIEAAAHYNTRALIPCVIPLLLGVACEAVYSPFYHRFEAYLDLRFAGTTSAILAVMPVALPATVALCLIIPLSRRMEQKLGVPCPHCGKALACYKGIVIASKNCPHCGMKVLDDNP